jgi:hypothetical protein
VGGGFTCTIVNATNILKRPYLSSVNIFNWEKSR